MILGRSSKKFSQLLREDGVLNRLQEMGSVSSNVSPNLVEYSINTSTRRSNRSSRTFSSYFLFPLILTIQGKIGFRALQRFQGIPTLPKGLKFHGKRRLRTKNDSLGSISNRGNKVYDPLVVEVNSSERNTSRAKLADRYKSAMLANHPDRGGSPYLALKINEARKVLHPFTR